ncbi:IclR family transcriptional regulator [Nocardiopsis aegyptia]|uniref:DNA-binding IclR family transcriptional regulator n=1 Tax=Nocardiopsis aegyptia TaxID=220378 RepID=A0A7Z0JA76_9ACTN|nr:IclR family transcriptional regulator [Nocardiopsis aegyptia]NYJ35013.1 DNA-binding IclR family transcriptional regulator [Nocardiopsis aegyptia]
MAAVSSVLVIEKAVKLLDCFTPERTHLSVGELHRLTGVPMSTVARLVNTLTTQELLHKDGDSYSIGLRVLTWMAAATAGSDFLEAVNQAAARLRDQTGETAGVYIPRGTTRVAVAVKLSTQSIIFRGYVGQVMPMRAAAAGKVFLAYDRHLLSAVLVEMNEGAGVEFPPELEAQLKLVRQQGWILTEEEREKGLNSIAAPIFDSTGTVVAALTIGGPSFRLNSQSAQEFGPLVAETAASLSDLSGHGSQGNTKRLA